MMIACLGSGAAAQAPAPGSLGMAVAGVEADVLAKALGIKKKQGILVTYVMPDSGAARAGIQPGDVVTGIDGVQATDAAQFVAAVQGRAQGATMTLAMTRYGVARSVNATLGPRAASEPTFDDVRSALGMTPDQLRARWGMLLDIAGQDYGLTVTKVSAGSSFRWAVPGRVLYERMWVAGGPIGERVIQFEGQDGVLGLYWKFPSGPVFRTTMRVAADGQLVSDKGATGGLGSGSYRLFIQRQGPGQFAFNEGTEKSEGFKQSHVYLYQPLNQAPGPIQVASAQYQVQLPLQSSLLAPAALPPLQQAAAPPPATSAAQVAAASAPPVVAATAVMAPTARPAGGARVALIIGNANYPGSFGRLANPINDAQSVASALRASGFEVTIVTDSDQRTMKRAINAFGQKLAAAGRGATGLFYYAGHGVQSRGVNYLVPVNAAIDSEADVDVEAVAADAVLRQMEEAGATTNIVILDACRNLPIQRSARDASRGLARMDAPNGSFVAYSTAPGAIAADGNGGNSPFAAALIVEMAKPGQQIEITFRNVRRAVMAATAGKQTPWDTSSLVDGFMFQP